MNEHCRFLRIEDHWRRCCSRVDCHALRAPETTLCHAHFVGSAVAARGGSMSIDQARQMVTAGGRAADWMADENDWIAG